MNLEALGWSNFWDDIQTQNKNLVRITAVHRNMCQGISENGDLNLYPSGKFQMDSENSLATGDWILSTPPFIDQQGKPAAIVEELLPRRSKISRVSAGSLNNEQVIAANIDNVLIVTSANSDLNVNRLQRYILMASEGNAKPVILLSKTDLTDEYSSLVDELSSAFPEIEITPLSTAKHFGLEQLSTILTPGSTSVFVGSSGVGKSTLVNHLLGDEIQSVREIRQDDGKGKHTTTSRELFFTPTGAMIIDTAGLREIQVFGDEENLKSIFGEIENLIQQCKFADCTHSSEPGCAVMEALDSGEISAKQFSSYQKLLKEIAYSNRKMNKQLSSNDKKRWKEITLNMRKRKKFEDR